MRKIEVNGLETLIEALTEARENIPAGYDDLPVIVGTANEHEAVGTDVTHVSIDFDNGGPVVLIEVDS